jgi:hypothetical protein
MDLQAKFGTFSEALKDIFKGFSNDMQFCIMNCVQCAQACEQLIHHCLNAGGAHADPDHIGLLQDCVDICSLTARYMTRESTLHIRACELCSEVCLACAIDCERFEEDSVMKSCAEVCRRCSESCQKMSAMVH